MLMLDLREKKIKEKKKICFLFFLRGICKYHYSPGDVIN